jgi:hypothetical protein
MRDQYAGDVSDYLKYAFLRAVLPEGTALGVAWYFLGGHDGRQDGRHDEYLRDPQWRDLDPSLFDRLKGREHRSVATIEVLDIWPSTTNFHRTEVPVARSRGAWADDMLRELKNCDAVFLDPDNGVSRPQVTSRKSATVEEVKSIVQSDRLGLLIRFPHRVTTHDIQLADYHTTFAPFRPITIRTCVRVPNANGGSSPRIRWFTGMNASDDVEAKMRAFADTVKRLPGASAEVAGPTSP